MDGNRGIAVEGDGKITLAPDITLPTAVATLVPTKSDNDVALELKARLNAVSQEHLIPILEEVCAHKINANINFSRDGFGRLQVIWTLTKEVGVP